MTVAQIQARLLSLRDENYRRFQCRLMPTVDPAQVIGVRTPALRTLSREIAKDADATQAFLAVLPHTYYEENNLHAFLLMREKQFDRAVAQIEQFLPHIDNWATCDSLRPPCFATHTEELRPFIDRWLSDAHPYTVRFGIECLMCYYLDKHFTPDTMAAVAAVRREEYYANMMVAWYFAAALAKRWDDALPYLQENRRSPWVHSKTIQKACESFRVSEGQKDALRKMRR
jgi:3-methyladenine DNA glycosylase AlkD